MARADFKEPEYRIILDPANPSHPGIALFSECFDDAKTFLSVGSFVVLSYLYPGNSPAIPSIPTITLHIRPLEGVAHTSNADIHLSADYIVSYHKNRSVQSLQHELRGVIVHELTHVWQAYGEKKLCSSHWIVEGIADYIRFRAGLGAEHWQRRSGGNWKDGYERTGFFLDWCEEKHEGLVIELNRWPDKGEEVFIRYCGATVQDLWEIYQDDLKKTEGIVTGEPPAPVPTHATYN
ncbi:hypothetical protein BC832DRAFT_557579 [Gaertneriomyces semiglobifer]|nr:hypothetical protein BC832DRAFT_557579 [Gaertneriomyces semiglobifer]